MDEVILRLALARQAADNANFAGTPRQAIADGYAAIDNVLSALLLNGRMANPFNHAQKLKLAKQHHPRAFEEHKEDLQYRNGRKIHVSPGLDWNDIASFYSEWNKARYEDFDATSNYARARTRMANRAVECGIRYLARVRGLDAKDLSLQVVLAAKGYTESVKDEALAVAHDAMFSEAERLGESYGRRLGVKLAAATNYCDLDVVAGDSLTREIISEDHEVAEAMADMYVRFVRFVEVIQEKRHDRLNDGKSGSEHLCGNIEIVPNFMLAVKTRFHGSTVHELSEGWGRAIAAALKTFGRNSDADG